MWIQMAEGLKGSIWGIVALGAIGSIVATILVAVIRKLAPPLVKRIARWVPAVVRRVVDRLLVVLQRRHNMIIRQFVRAASSDMPWGTQAFFFRYLVFAIFWEVMGAVWFIFMLLTSLKIGRTEIPDATLGTMFGKVALAGMGFFCWMRAFSRVTCVMMPWVEFKKVRRMILEEENRKNQACLAGSLQPKAG